MTRVEQTDGSVTVYNYDDFGNRTSVVITSDATTSTALISASPTAGSAPLEVFFTDQSVGDVTSWVWDFGDGSTSALQNPSHIYQNSGAYSVSLTVDGSSGSDTVTQVGYIQVNHPVVEGSLSVSPAIQDFLGTAVATQTSPVEFILSNGTSDTIDVYDLAITGTNASDFVVVSDSCSNQSVVPLGSCNVSVAFAPTAEGDLRALLSLPNSLGETKAALAGSGYKAGSVVVPAFDTPLTRQLQIHNLNMPFICCLGKELRQHYPLISLPETLILICMILTVYG
ncbi:MAG: hypothetical protein DRJ64_06225 [Thermoprotei archaeon]|nr:MAG: hypothetical protein DRJ64_06225 [Thermoprotei archaeon]